jgi:hypothetical protein
MFTVLNEPPEDRVPVESLTDKQLRELLHWDAMHDRELLLTACRNRKITHVDHNVLERLS